jgi:pyroglutamyl-peptidase
MLLTGFEGYGGRTINPAGEIVRRLDGARIGATPVHGRTLPVCYAEIRPRLAALIDELQPRAVICLGLCPGEPMLRIERLAANIADFEIADNLGLVANEAVVEDGPAAFLSTLPIEAIRDRLLAAGIPARLSGTAGQFVCNALMYHALRLCAERSPPPRCGFIHLPYLPEQVALLMAQARDHATVELRLRADLASMALETMADGVRLAIETTLEAAPPGA